MKLYIALIFAAFLLSTIQAFCVYNDSEDNSFYMRQMPLNSAGTYYSRFRRESLNPGEHACCNYSTKDCNKNGNPDDVVVIAYQAMLNGKGRGVMFTVSMTAGGWIVFSGAGLDDPTIKVFNADGSPYQFEFQKAPRAILLN